MALPPGTVMPGTAAQVNVLIMGCRRIAKTSRLKIFAVGIKFSTNHANLIAHIRQHFAKGRNDLAAAANVAAHLHTDGRTDHIGIGMVGQEPVDQFNGLEGITALMRAADDHIHILPGNVGICLVEVEVIAGQEAVRC